MSDRYETMRKNKDYVKELMTDEEFINLLDDTNVAELIAESVSKKDYKLACEKYISLFKKTSENRSFAGIEKLAEIGKYISENVADDEIADIVSAADRICDGFIPVLPGNGKYGLEIIFDSRPYPWNGWFFDTSQAQMSLARFGWMLNLSRAYCVTGNDKYVEKINDLLEDFIAECPVPKSGHFSSEHCTWDSYTVGVRVYHLPEILLACMNSSKLSQEVTLNSFPR